MFLNKHYEIPFVKECVALFPLPVTQDRHRLHSAARDDLARQVPQMLQQYFHSNQNQYNAPSHFRSFTECFHHMISTEYSHETYQEGNHPDCK